MNHPIVNETANDSMAMKAAVVALSLALGLFAPLQASAGAPTSYQADFKESNVHDSAPPAYPHDCASTQHSLPIYNGSTIVMATIAQRWPMRPAG
jgi:hypothetical protein